MLLQQLAVAGQLASAIEWDAPAPPCPAAADVEQAVQRLAGRLPEVDEIQARATVSRVGDRWRLQLATVVGGEAQERTLEADSCDALARATAIVVAVAIDPIGAAHEVRRAERIEAPTDAVLPPTIASDVEAETTPAPRPDAPVRSTPRRRVQFHLGIGGGVAIGAVPSVMGGPVAAVGLSVSRFRAELRGAWWPPAVERDGGASARIQLGTIAVLACGEPGPARATFPLCAGIETGAMRADGQGVPNATTRHLPWLAAIVGAGVRGWVRPRIGLRADVEVAVPLAIDRVVVGSPDAEDPNIVYQSPPVGARGLFGVEFRLL